MKVNELREIIKKYNHTEKDKIIVELYKRIPKATKEDYDIDQYITNINEELKNTKVKKEEVAVTIESLKKEVDYFIECAKADLYSEPNNVISKSERSKWRFKVKKFYKELNSFLPTTEDGTVATDLLKDLFENLSYGTHYLMFSNWNTFGAIQISQSEFLKTIIGRKLANGVTKENLAYCVDLLDVKYDPQGYHSELFIAFESYLKTVDTKYIAIELLDKKVNFWNEKYKKNNSYENESYVNYFTECIVDIYFGLSEVQDGVKYFHKHYIEKRNKEIKEYILLEKLKEYELYNDWVAEYEKHLGKINYRDSLKEDYKKIKAGFKVKRY